LTKIAIIQRIVAATQAFSSLHSRLSEDQGTPLSSRQSLICYGRFDATSFASASPDALTPLPPGSRGALSGYDFIVVYYLPVV